MNEDQVRKARQQLLRELPDPTEILRGSLLDRGSSIARVARSAVGEKATGCGSSPLAIPEDAHASSLCQPNKSHRSSGGCEIIESCEPSWKRFASSTTNC